MKKGQGNTDKGRKMRPFLSDEIQREIMKLEILTRGF